MAIRGMGWECGCAVTAWKSGESGWKSKKYGESGW